MSTSQWLAGAGVGTTGVVLGFVLGRLTARSSGGFRIDWRLRVHSGGKDEPPDEAA